jgi:superfamily II DNA or RNA helicase
MLEHDIGVLVASPGFGKTVAGIFLATKRSTNVLILVHRKPLLDQWKLQLANFLAVEPNMIGQIGAGKHEPSGKMDVAMVQSLVRKDKVDAIVSKYCHVIVDECHHIPAFSFERIMNEVNARYIVGLTATPHRKDGLHPIIQMQCGPIRFSETLNKASIDRPFEHCLIIRETDFKPEDESEEPSIQEIYRLLLLDESRNNMILDDIINALDEGRSPIVLTERKEHLEYLTKHLINFTKHIIVLHGGTTQKKSDKALEQLKNIPDDEERLIIATGRYIGEGFDDARLDTLFLAMPISWKGTLIQYAGRLHRLHPGKKEVRIYDYLDSNVQVLVKMFNKRLKGYQAMGYKSPITS